MQEICDTCHAGYEVTPANARLALFIGYPPANHLIATCSCGATEIIYMGGKSIMQLMDSGKFSIILSNEPTSERREAADHTWENARGTAAGDDLPHPPREWLRQLHDDLRTFGND
jgi:hypothetical protein